MLDEPDVATPVVEETTPLRAHPTRPAAGARIRRAGAGVCVTTAALGLVAALGISLAAPAGAAVPTASRECRTVVDDLSVEVRGAAAAAQGAAAGSDAQEQRDEKITGLFDTANAEHPECGQAISAYQRQLQAAAATLGQPAERGTPFLGPIGWAWNAVFYRLFDGNIVLMVLFGWVMLLSPFLLLLSGWWVIKGASDSLRKPEPPDDIALAQ